MAEKSVQTVKNLMKKAVHHGNDLHLALLDFCNTPRADAIGSPAQLLMGRWTKALLPSTSTLLEPKTVNPSVVQRKLALSKAQQKIYYDRHTRPLPELLVGESVLMQTKDGRWKPAVVTSINQTAPRSYFIRTPEGNQYRRNRQQLRKRFNVEHQFTTKGNSMDDQVYDSDVKENARNQSLSSGSASVLSQHECPRCTIMKPLRYRK